jgi:hypothetical protein
MLLGSARQGIPGKPSKERVSGSYDFENEFQFQLQGYASATKTVNPGPHNLV